VTTFGRRVGMDIWFQRIALFASATVGSPAAFLLACFVVIIWATTDPLMNYSDTWQLLIKLEPAS
jgi:low affinity Fe/Cu permease